MEHWGNNFYIVTNMCGACPNSKLVKAPIESPGKNTWQEVLPYKADTKIDYLVVFKGHIVINGRCNGLKMCRVLDMATPTPKV